MGERNNQRVLAIIHDGSLGKQNPTVGCRATLTAKDEKNAGKANIQERTAQDLLRVHRSNLHVSQCWFLSLIAQDSLGCSGDLGKSQ